MDIRDVNIHNIKDLSAEDRTKLERRAIRNFMSFMALKWILMIGIAALGKTLARRYAKKD